MHRTIMPNPYPGNGIPPKCTQPLLTAEEEETEELSKAENYFPIKTNIE